VLDREAGSIPGFNDAHVHFVNGGDHFGVQLKTQRHRWNLRADGERVKTTAKVSGLLLETGTSKNGRAKPSAKRTY